MDKVNQSSDSQLIQSKQQQAEDTIGLLVHSYNNYLSGVLGFTELALMECNQEVVRERLSLAMDSGNEAVIFGKQLLSSISRLQVKLVATDINSLLTELSDKITGLQFEKLATEEQTDCMIKTDKNWFLSCLEGLVNFCQDYSKDKNVIIKCNSLKESLSIRLLTKFELSEEQSIKLFDPFYASRTLLGKKDIGLSMLKGFVIQMGGEVQWSNQGGFVITLPKIAIAN